ncbi:MAG: hypothetical protein ACMXYF_04590 [Candidatus Woesearchaeota archaeon]
MSEEFRINERELSFTGYFHIKEIKKIIETHIAQKGYDKQEIVHEVQHRKDGNYTFIKLYPIRRFTDEETFTLELTYGFGSITQEKLKGTVYDKGTFFISMGGTLDVDTAGKWSSFYDGLGLLIRFIGNMFVFKEHHQSLIDDCKQDRDELYQALLSYCNGQKINR